MIESSTSKMDRIVRLARTGPIRARDLDADSIPRTYLKRLCDAGVLERVDRGLYRLVDGPVVELSSLADVAKRVPHGVVCLLSALQVHGLTSEVPHAVWLMLDRRAWRPGIANPMLEIVRASGDSFTHGVEKRRVDGVDVRIFTAAKTVADCFKYRRHVGLEVALAALKDYLSSRTGTIGELVAAAKVDRVYSIMSPYMRALA